MKVLSVRTIVTTLLGILIPFTAAASTQTVTLNDGSIVQSNTNRIGVNIGSISYYDNGQVLKNLIGTINPGFEPLQSKQIWVVQTAGTTTYPQHGGVGGTK